MDKWKNNNYLMHTNENTQVEDGWDSTDIYEEKVITKNITLFDSRENKLIFSVRMNSTKSNSNFKKEGRISYTLLEKHPWIEDKYINLCPYNFSADSINFKNDPVEFKDEDDILSLMDDIIETKVKPYCENNPKGAVASEGLDWKGFLENFLEKKNKLSIEDFKL